MAGLTPPGRPRSGPKGENAAHVSPLTLARQPKILHAVDGEHCNPLAS